MAAVTKASSCTQVEAENKYYCDLSAGHSNPGPVDRSPPPEAQPAVFLLVHWQRPGCEMCPDAEMQTIWTLGWLALPSMNVAPLAHGHGVS